MAALTFNAAVQAEGNHIVTRSTDDAIGSDAAALVIDDTLTSYQIRQAVSALMRALNRAMSKTNLPAEIPTTGTSLE